MRDVQYKSGLFPSSETLGKFYNKNMTWRKIAFEIVHLNSSQLISEVLFPHTKSIFVVLQMFWSTPDDYNFVIETCGEYDKLFGLKISEKSKQFRKSQGTCFLWIYFGYAFDTYLRYVSLY